MNMGERIKEWRTQNGLTQQQLSDLTGITLRTIQRIERNDVKPSLHSMNKLSEALGFQRSDVQDPEPADRKQITITINVTGMHQLLKDLKQLIRNNWKTILIIFLAVLFILNYTEIKAGFIDGWSLK